LYLTNQRSKNTEGTNERATKNKMDFFSKKKKERITYDPFWAVRNLLDVLENYGRFSVGGKKSLKLKDHPTPLERGEVNARPGTLSRAHDRC